jgi:hypothetical protein
MRFCTFLQLNEWIYDQPALREKAEKDIISLKTFIKTKDYIKAESLLEQIWKKLFMQYNQAVSQKEENEIVLLKPLLNYLHKINTSTSEIRNVSTQLIT